jgi:AbrB family looped-hinge helix DNA binding protein
MKGTIDNFGRIVVPAKMREQLGIQPYDRLEITVYGSTIEITKSNQIKELVAKMRSLQPSERKQVLEELKR